MQSLFVFARKKVEFFSKMWYHIIVNKKRIYEIAIAFRKDL